jgi:hypothetical protein
MLRLDPLRGPAAGGPGWCVWYAGCSARTAPEGGRASFFAEAPFACAGHSRLAPAMAYLTGGRRASPVRFAP